MSKKYFSVIQYHREDDMSQDALLTKMFAPGKLLDSDKKSIDSLEIGEQFDYDYDVGGTVEFIFIKRIK